MKINPPPDPSKDSIENFKIDKRYLCRLIFVLYICSKCLRLRLRTTRLVSLLSQAQEEKTKEKKQTKIPM